MRIRAGRIGRIAAAVEKFQARQPGETDAGLIDRYLTEHLRGMVEAAETLGWVTENRPTQADLFE
jgi:hypothetical protein